MSADHLTVALGYAARGWPLFPLEAGGKRPLGAAAPHGLKDASLDPEKVRGWWRRWPTANIGLRTGVAFDVLDLDSDDAVAALDAAMPLADNPDDDQIVLGPTVRTPRGWHVYVAPTGLGNRAGLLPGVDWRGAGGYVVAPGSVKDDGARWAWYLPADPLYGPDADIRPAPAWLLALLEKPAPPPAVHLSTPPRDLSAYTQRAIEAEAGRVALAAEGTRNDQLNRSAHALGQLVAGGCLDVHAAGDALLIAAIRCGLSEAEAVATIRSGLRAGMRSPRQPKTSR